MSQSLQGSRPAFAWRARRFASRKSGLALAMRPTVAIVAQKSSVSQSFRLHTPALTIADRFYRLAAGSGWQANVGAAVAAAVATAVATAAGAAANSKKKHSSILGWCLNGQPLRVRLANSGLTVTAPHERKRSPGPDPIRLTHLSMARRAHTLWMILILFRRFKRKNEPHVSCCTQSLTKHEKLFGQLASWILSFTVPSNLARNCAFWKSRWF